MLGAGDLQIFAVPVFRVQGSDSDFIPFRGGAAKLGSISITYHKYILGVHKSQTSTELVDLISVYTASRSRTEPTGGHSSWAPHGTALS